ncbi:MAG: hypothetical protein ACREOZ_01365, partial [Gloeomargaritales cyanobacterium]
HYDYFLSPSTLILSMTAIHDISQHQFWYCLTLKPLKSVPSPPPLDLNGTIRAAHHTTKSLFLNDTTVFE